MLVIGFNFGS
ncbi:hypothetical protein RDI58_029261 [Solanum bulbocastanum]|uniref:Uncharacterized protein n=1 Tax=Solanum bulbocastanum TaxID=147425 RepID=A0AAN8SU09_SOLBU